MTTLIFATKKNLKSRFGNGEVIEFVKEGMFTDAMNFFDDQYPTFYNEETGIYSDSDGNEIISDAKLKASNEHINDIGASFFKNYYTRNSDNLSTDELIAISNDYFAVQYFLDNEYTEKEFKAAKDVNEIGVLVECGTGYYL